MTSVLSRTKIMKTLIAALTALIAFPAFAADPLDGLDAAIAKGLKAHGVAGIGLAIVKDGKIVHAKGYGVKTIGQTDPVTEHSLFAIGSVSKSFTATALGLLVDEGKIGWNNPLTTRVKSFRLISIMMVSPMLRLPHMLAKLAFIEVLAMACSSCASALPLARVPSKSRPLI